jgi:anti-sigma B factor antagonist
MSSLFTIQQIGPATVVEIHAVALMEQPQIDAIAEAISKQIDDQGKHKLVVDFATVEYMSSRAINMILVLKKKLSDLPGAELILCGVGERLSQLIHITRLDQVLNIKPSQHDAVAALHS